MAVSILRTKKLLRLRNDKNKEYYSGIFRMIPLYLWSKCCGLEITTNRQLAIYALSHDYFDLDLNEVSYFKKKCSRSEVPKLSAKIY